MKIAVASNDGKSVCEHFGRSRCFVVFEVAEGKITGENVRENLFTAHAQGQHVEGEHHGDSHHSHEDIAGALADCQAVLCGGMGGRAAADLMAKGIRPVVLGEALTPREAVEALLAGKLRPGKGFCRCHE